MLLYCISKDVSFEEPLGDIHGILGSSAKHSLRSAIT